MQPENSSFRRSKVGEQCANLQTLVMNEGLAGGRSLTTTLTAIAGGHMHSAITDLMPLNYTAKV